MKSNNEIKMRVKEIAGERKYNWKGKETGAK